MINFYCGTPMKNWPLPRENNTHYFLRSSINLPFALWVEKEKTIKDKILNSRNNIVKVDCYGATLLGFLLQINSVLRTRNRSSWCEKLPLFSYY